MSDTVVLRKKDDDVPEVLPTNEIIENEPKTIVPEYEKLQAGLVEANKLVDDIILKKYLHNLTDLEIIPLDDSLKKISDIRLFRITEMVYQKNEYSTYKFASVFNSVQNLKPSLPF